MQNKLRPFGFRTLNRLDPRGWSEVTTDIAVTASTGIVVIAGMLALERHEQLSTDTPDQITYRSAQITHLAHIATYAHVEVDCASPVSS